MQGIYNNRVLMSFACANILQRFRINVNICHLVNFHCFFFQKKYCWRKWNLYLKPLTICNCLLHWKMVHCFLVMSFCFSLFLLFGILKHFVKETCLLTSPHVCLILFKVFFFTLIVACLNSSLCILHSSIHVWRLQFLFRLPSSTLSLHSYLRYCITEC